MSTVGLLSDCSSSAVPHGTGAGRESASGTGISGIESMGGEESGSSLASRRAGWKELHSGVCRMPWWRKVSRNIFSQKPMDVILEEDSEGHLERSLSLVDLLAIGIGGTVGSGIFVTAGLIAHVYAGPSAILCWLLGGMVCTVSGLSYAEMSSRIPSAGSTYAYVFHTMGELPAFVAGGLLTLEYGVSGAAVARSWGDKVVYAIVQGGVDGFGWLNNEHCSIAAGAVQFLSVLLLLFGLSLGTKTIKVITAVKVILVLFMIIAGFTLFNSENLSPLVPPPHEFQPSGSDKEGGLKALKSFGINGILMGATQAFFGFVGFDEVCCMAAQTKNAKKIMPKAVVGTIAGVTVLSAGATLALVAMVSYTEISGVSAFSSAFDDRGYGWASTIVTAGEIGTLPVVVLVSDFSPRPAHRHCRAAFDMHCESHNTIPLTQSNFLSHCNACFFRQIAFLAQPQLLFAMAQDGLLPSIFAKVNKNKTLFWGTAISGMVMITVALFVPFTNLGDMISAGVLLSFNMTNCSLVILRIRELSEGGERKTKWDRKGRLASSQAPAASVQVVGPVLLLLYTVFVFISAAKVAGIMRLWSFLLTC